LFCCGAVAELADAEDLKSSGGDTLWVQVPLAPLKDQIALVFSLLMESLLGFLPAHPLRSVGAAGTPCKNTG
jgi:hypothetical protein